MGTNTDPDRKVVVRQRAVIAQDVLELVLEPADGVPLPAWEPGAHIDLAIDADTIRQYSLSGDPADRQAYRIAVLKEPDGRGGSARIHDELQTGDTVSIRGPRNHFPLLDAPAYVFVAGGIGITPLLPMVRQVEASGRDWQLHYAGRSRPHMAYLPELDHLARGRGVVHVAPSSDGGRMDVRAALSSAAPGAIVCCCGPAPLIAATEDAAQRHGLSFRAERFVRQEIKDAVDTAFTVNLAASGLELIVPADRSLLDVLLDADIDVPSSCEEGTCGTCEVNVLDGAPDHRDSILTAEERATGDWMYVCVSRACSETLVLDL